MVKWKVDPSPTSDSTHIFPPWRSTILEHMASPIPVPGYFAALVGALEHSEYAILVPGSDSDAVVGNGEIPRVVATVA